MTSSFLHAQHGTNAITRLHVLKCRIDFFQRVAMGDEFVDLEPAPKVIANEIGELGAALDSSKSTAFPYTSCHELECWILTG